VKRSTFVRALLGATLFLALGGPAPGAVGSCGGEVATVDPEQFCFTRKKYECDRTEVRQQAGFANEPAPIPAPDCVDNPATAVNEVIACNHTFCVNQIPVLCTGMTWWCTPPPSETVTNDCLAALREPTLLDQRTSDIYECLPTTICPASAAPLTEALDESPYDPEPPASAPASSTEVP
jgi:hypothetical protein